MSKATFGIAAAVGLAISPAWAGDEKSDDKSTSDAGASSASERVGQGESATFSVVDASHDSGTMKESTEVRASQDESKSSENERWLREREGYRDGGY